MSQALIAVLVALKLITLPMAVSEMSARTGVDPALASCIVSHESNWDTNLVSKDQDTGLFQIIPSTARWVAEQMGLDRYDLTDPITNATMGLWILKRYPEWYSSLYLCED